MSDSKDPIEMLMAEFAANSGVVNPPEATKVLVTQTVPEVQGQPEPAVEAVTVAPPTEKPPEVVAAEAAKKTRGRKPAAASAGDVSRSLAEFSTEDLVATLKGRGYSVYLAG